MKATLALALHLARAWCVGALAILSLAASACDQAEGTDDDPESAPQTGHERMVSILADIALRTEVENPFLSAEFTEEARVELANLGADAPPEELFDALFQTSFEEVRLGNERAAIELLQRASELAKKSPGVIPEWKVQEGEYRLSVAWMRLGETENCCDLPTSESCIFPIRGDGVHGRTEGSRQAITHLTSILERVPPGSVLGLKARWLINLAYMTLGEWPKGVPRQFRLPPAALASGEEFPRFENVALALGIDSFDLAGGAIAEDFDRDGDLDILTSTWDTRGPLQFLVNEGAAGFVERTDEAGLTGIVSGLNMVHADYDNDGYADVLVLRGAWLGPGGRHPNSLLRNGGDGTFTDVTFEAGLGERWFPTQGAAWADYDLDGDLDLYVCAESGNDLGAQFTEREAAGAMHEPGQLFRNRGDGTFEDVAVEAGVENLRFAKGAVWGDYDGDRYPDLYVSNLGAGNRLYRNRGDGTFEDVAEKLAVARPTNSFSAWFWDYDNDGDLDLYVTTFQSGPTALAYVVAGYLGADTRREREAPRLYRNDGGRFTEVADEQGVARESLTMGANFGDLDGDGWLDFYLGTGFPDYEALTPNVMYRNRGGTGFSDVTQAGGFGHLQKGHGIAFADFDNDGDQDVLAQMGGAFPGDKYGNALFENPGFGRRWLALDLEGVRSNRAAIGARIRVDVVQGETKRSIHRAVGSGGSFGGNPMRQTIGLDRADRIERLEVWWPATDERQVFTDVPLDTFVKIVEGQGELQRERIVARPFPVGGDGPSNH